MKLYPTTFCVDFLSKTINRFMFVVICTCLAVACSTNSDENNPVNDTGVEVFDITPSGFTIKFDETVAGFSKAALGIDNGVTVNSVEPIDGLANTFKVTTSPIELSTKKYTLSISGHSKPFNNLVFEYIKILEEGEFRKVGNPAGVVNFVTDPYGFDVEGHGTRIVKTHFENSKISNLHQIIKSPMYVLNGRGSQTGTNIVSYVFAALSSKDTKVFWTSSSTEPEYSKKLNPEYWFFMEGNNRPFLKDARDFAVWMKDQNVLYIGGVDNNIIDDAGNPVFTDTERTDYEDWHPMSGPEEYMVYSGVGVENVIWSGAISSVLGQETASGAVKANGVFTPHMLYVVSPDGSTSHAVPIVAACALEVAKTCPAFTSKQIKLKLMSLAKTETLPYFNGVEVKGGTVLTTPREIKVLRMPLTVPDCTLP